MGETVCKGCLQKEFMLRQARQSVSELVTRHNDNVANVKRLKERWEEAEREVRQAVLAEVYQEAVDRGDTDTSIAVWLKEQLEEQE